MPYTPTAAFIRTADPPARQVGTARLLVGAQAVLLAVLGVMPRGTDWPVPGPVRWLGALTVVGGGGIAAVGASALGRGLTAVPLPNDYAQLRTGGLYRWVRHPIYTGVLLAAAGRTLSSGNRWALMTFAALVGLLTGKARFEERHLTGRFPGYQRYVATTPRFLPRLGAAHRISPPRCSSSPCCETGCTSAGAAGSAAGPSARTTAHQQHKPDQNRAARNR